MKASERESASHREDFASEITNGSVIKDDAASVSIYTPIGGDDERSHKKLHILDGGKPRRFRSSPRS